MQQQFSALSTLSAFVLSAALAQSAIAQDAKKATPVAPAASAPAASAPAMTKKVVVNGVMIPQGRFDALLAEGKQQGGMSDAELYGRVKDELVTREVLMQAATKKGLEKKAEVANALDLSRQDVLVRALIEDHVKNNPVTDAELKKQYDTFKVSLGDNEYKVRHILVEKEDEAKAVIAELKKGGDFNKIAKDKSKDTGSKDSGGDLDWGPAGRYVKPFADALKTLKKGDLTDTPIKTDFGFHVIKLDDQRAMKAPSFEEMKPKFQERASQEQVGKLIQDLRGKAKVEER